jgi:hypothetical protein
VTFHERVLEATEGARIDIIDVAVVIWWW